MLGPRLTIEFVVKLFDSEQANLTRLSNKWRVDSVRLCL